MALLFEALLCVSNAELSSPRTPVEIRERFLQRPASKGELLTRMQTINDLSSKPVKRIEPKYMEPPLRFGLDRAIAGDHSYLGEWRIQRILAVFASIEAFKGGYFEPLMSLGENERLDIPEVKSIKIDVERHTAVASTKD